MEHKLHNSLKKKTYCGCYVAGKWMGGSICTGLRVFLLNFDHLKKLRGCQNILKAPTTKIFIPKKIEN